MTNQRPFKRIEFQLSAPAPKFFPPEDLLEVAFAGRSNVGKSSLLNAMAEQRQLARTSKTPGRTREINFFEVDGRYRIVDLPGYGFAKAPKNVAARWQHLMDSYLRRRDNLAGVILLFDIRHEPSNRDHQMVELLADAEVPFAIVLTKADKLSRVQAEKSRKHVERLFAGIEAYAVSSMKRQGLDAVWDLVLSAVGEDREPATGG